MKDYSVLLKFHINYAIKRRNPAHGIRLDNYESNHLNFRTFICEILHYSYCSNLLYSLNAIS